MKVLGEMDLGSATTFFIAMDEDASSPMLELTHNHDRTEPYDKGNVGVASTVDDIESTVASLKEQGVTVTVEPKMLTADGQDYEIAFIEAPDGYEIELIQRGTMKVGGSDPTAR
jgi:lactoylglutathione lyase